MTREEAKTCFGDEVFSTPKAVVRIKEENGEIHIHIHRKQDDILELLPRGYIIGDNILIWKEDN